VSDIPTVLVVDDEAAIREMLQLALELAGFRVLQAPDATAALTMIVDERPDLVLLDWMMPGTSGFELLRRLRRDELTAPVPVILLTARAEEGNRVQGLEGGADDYVVKPFSPRELVARIRALLRRAAPPASETPIEVSGLKLDPVARRVRVHGRAVSMGPTEFRLLHFLMSHPERAWSRAQLLDHVWGASVYIDERTVDVHVRRLRKALEPANDEEFDCGRLVQTVRGTGYRFSGQLDGS
jgi:two-component system phosphate regulon response regulator PhoB